MAKLTYLVTIDDSPINENYGQENRIKMTLHEGHHYLSPDAVGHKIESVYPPDRYHIPAGAAALFAMVFGNPPEAGNEELHTTGRRYAG